MTREVCVHAGGSCRDSLHPELQLSMQDTNAPRIQQNEANSRGMKCSFCFKIPSHLAQLEHRVFKMQGSCAWCRDSLHLELQGSMQTPRIQQNEVNSNKITPWFCRAIWHLSKVKCHKRGGSCPCWGCLLQGCLASSAPSQACIKNSAKLHDEL